MTTLKNAIDLPDLPPVAALDNHHAVVPVQGLHGDHGAGLQLDTGDHATGLNLETADHPAGLNLETADHPAGLNLDTVDHNRAGLQLETADHPAGLQLDEWSAVHAVDTQCYAAVTPAAAEQEDRVMEALGISNKVSNHHCNFSSIVLDSKSCIFHQSGDNVGSSVYNENFTLDRARQQHQGDHHLSLWIDDLTSDTLMDTMEAIMSPASTSLEEVSCPQDLMPRPHHMSPISPATSLPSSSSIASVDNVLDQR